MEAQTVMLMELQMDMEEMESQMVYPMEQETAMPTRTTQGVKKITNDLYTQSIFSHKLWFIFTSSMLQNIKDHSSSK